MSRLYMMVTITDRNRKKKFEEFYEKNEHMVFFTTLGRGTANSEMLDYFGLEESEKVVILSVVTEETWKKLRREMIVKMQIDVPGTGIAFIVPLSSIGGEKTLHFLIQSEKFEREEESTLKETEYELLVAIANQGCIDTVMDVARSVGAGGGTVIHAKGTGNGNSRKISWRITGGRKRNHIDRHKKETEKCNHESHDGADRTCQQRKNNYIFPAGHKHSRT